MNLTTRLCIVLRLRMNGFLPPFLFYVFTECTGKVITFFSLYDVIFQKT